MRKSFLSLVLIFIMVFSASAQLTETETILKGAITNDTIDGWKKGATTFIGTSQTSLTNWAAGGNSSLAINGLINSFANLKKGKINWDNSLVIGYGVLKKGDEDFEKSDDRIDLMSKLGYQALKKWNYTALVNFRTQMAKGYNYPSDDVISKFLAPAYILTAAGFDYKPNDKFSAFIAPVTSKFTIVNDQALADSGAFGVDPGKKSRSEFGGYIRMAYKTNVIENVDFETKLDMFSNYLDNPGKIDVNWETLTTLKVNEFLSATIATHLIYDYDIDIAETNDDGEVISTGPKVQFKEVLSLGFTLKF